jgi:ParB/RepB/Spo0J family partition protein
MTKRAPNVQYLPIDQLVPAEDNFRGPVGDVSELAESIRAVGILQHLVVTPKGDGGYRLVFGHRRLEAARQAGLTEVPAEIRDYSDAERFTAMFAENYGRKDLSPLQEARAYQAMLELTDGRGRKVFTQRSLAKRLGVGQAKISNYTGIFKLPERVVTMLEQGELTVTEAVLLVRLAKYPDRVEAALADYGRHAHRDMDLAVRSQQADLEREERVEQVRHDLQAAGVRLAPDDWRERGGKRLGDGYYELRMAVEDHAGEPCHAAMVTHHGDVAYVCTDPDRHQPAQEPAADTTPAATTAAAETPTPAAAEPATPTGATADVDPDAQAAPALAVVPPPPEPTEEELEARRRMEEARQAAERERQERERLARERAEQLEAAYQARTSALQALLGGRLSRPEATRLLAWFLVRLAFQDYQYDDGFVRGLLRLDETTDAVAGAESPVLALAGKNDDGLLRVAVAIAAEHVEELLGVADEPDFTSPIVALYYAFLTKAAAYRPSKFELAELGASDAEEAEDPAEPSEQEEATGVA